MRNAATAELTERFGTGYWSTTVSPESVARGIGTSKVLVAVVDGRVVGTLRLLKKKPWAIDLAYFHIVPHPLHLVDMAVDPAHQGRGIGRQLLEGARRTAEGMGADSMRLDAYDSAAGAGGFYAACGYTARGGKSYRSVPLLYYELLLRSPGSGDGEHSGD